MNMQLAKTPIGLDGIAAAETVLSHVDGERGELIIAGERVGDLVRQTGFEGVTARLWWRNRPADRRGQRARRLGCCP
jgi:citrate synthase